MAEQSDVIGALATAFVSSLGVDYPANVESRGRWLVRVITSLLIFPGHDEADERAMLAEFVAPVVVPAEQQPVANGAVLATHPGETMQQPGQRNGDRDRRDKQPKHRTGVDMIPHHVDHREIHCHQVD